MFGVQRSPGLIGALWLVSEIQPPLMADVCPGRQGVFAGQPPRHCAIERLFQPGFDLIISLLG